MLNSSSLFNINKRLKVYRIALIAEWQELPFHKPSVIDSNLDSSICIFTTAIHVITLHYT